MSKENSAEVTAAIHLLLWLGFLDLSKEKVTKRNCLAILNQVSNIIVFWRRQSSLLHLSKNTAHDMMTHMSQINTMQFCLVFDAIDR